jgi:hypothetical protein
MTTYDEIQTYAMNKAHVWAESYRERLERGALPEHMGYPDLTAEQVIAEQYRHANQRLFWGRPPDLR